MHPKITFDGFDYTLFPRSAAVSFSADPRKISQTLKHLEPNIGKEKLPYD